MSLTRESCLECAASLVVGVAAIFPIDLDDLAFGHTTFYPPPHPIPHLSNHNLRCHGHPPLPLEST
jgi:hypothetical protein